MYQREGPGEIMKIILRKHVTRRYAIFNREFLKTVFENERFTHNFSWSGEKKIFCYMSGIV